MRRTVRMAVSIGMSASLSVLPRSGRGEAKTAIPIEPGKLVVVKKLLVSDCRVVRGFLGTPVDGSVHSWDYRGRVREYPNAASDGVVYAYNGNDGVHITLADGGGFDAVVLRGGAKTRMFVNQDSLVEPTDRKPTWVFNGGAACQIARFDKRVTARKVSFFGTSDGAIADVGFYRIERPSPTQDIPDYWFSGSFAPAGERDDNRFGLTEPRSPFAPASIRRAMKERYGEIDYRPVSFDLDDFNQWSVNARRDKPLHLISPPVGTTVSVGTVGIPVKLDGIDGPFSFTACVQDPLNPRLDLTWIEFSAPGPGLYSIVLDIPVQILFPENRLWLTFVFDSNVRLSAVKKGNGFWFGSPVLHRARPEALAWRKFLLKTYFSLLSEPRPWGRYRRQSRQEFYAGDQYAGQCPELFMTIDQCYTLDPNDDAVRQYREWVYLQNLKELSEVSPPPRPPPDWAWYPRLAWLETRRIAEWWLDERLVPTGEFGGRVGDDSDFYQQFTDLPFFEDGGVAERMKNSAARMAELAQKNNLRGGINANSTDALHAYEEGINHLALMARWFYGDPIYFERCMESARNMEKLTIVTEDGRRHFRDRERMGARDLDQPRKPAVDGHATPLMWHTALQVADYNRNPQALKLVREWADSWLRFMKPGQWATAVEVVSGKVVSATKDRPLYGGYRTQASVFTWLFSLTGDRRYIEPFLYYYGKGQAPLPAGSFLADVCALGGLSDINGEQLTRLAESNPTFFLYLTGDSSKLIEAAIGAPRRWSAAIGNLNDARRWPDMYTTTHQFTDRVFPSLLEHASMAYLGGFCRRNKFNPTLAVSWEGFGTDYAALVFSNRRNELKVCVYSFSDHSMKGKMRVWALEHGRYRVVIGPDTHDDRQMDSIDTSATVALAKAGAIDLALAPKTITLVEVRQIEQLDSIFTRADLAIAAREVNLTGDTLSGMVHNIGSADAADVEIAVIAANFEVLARQSLGRLAAPIDLRPKRAAFEIRLPRKPGKGCKVVLDPERRIPEIYEGNNSVSLDALLALDSH